MNFLDQFVAKTLPLVPRSIVKHVSNRYIAGESIPDGIETIRRLNGEGFTATIDVLGEFITSKEEAEVNADEYIHTLNAIAHQRVDSNISIKPTSMGLLLDEEFCYQTMKRIVEVADKMGIFVRIDMEDVECTDKEFRLLEKLRKDFPKVGIVLQAYLKRTEDDVKNMIKNKVNCRICKGIYIEEPHHLIENANTDRLAINPYFINHIEQFLKSKTYVGIATHDEKVVEAAFDLIEKTKADPKDFEFQMLLGVREELRNEIRDRGYKVRVYVPFGKDWYGYSVRRLNENPSIAGYVIKATLFGD